MPISTPAQRDAIYRSDYLAFARKAFYVFSSDTYSQEWFHESVAQRLNGSIGRATRQIINAPPRALKSYLVSVAWTAFRLGQDPTHKFICVSYSQDLANKHSADCRRIMESPWYRALFSTRLDKSTENQLATTNGGCRLAMSVGGTLTGFGADTIIVDDPLNAAGAASDVTRKHCNEWFDRSLMSRLNDKSKGSIIVLMQRLHQQDLTGHLIQRRGWDHLVLPAVAAQDTKFRLQNRSFFGNKESLYKRESPSKSWTTSRAKLDRWCFKHNIFKIPLRMRGMTSSGNGSSRMMSFRPVSRGTKSYSPAIWPRKLVRTATTRLVWPFLSAIGTSIILLTFGEERLPSTSFANSCRRK
ncbi:hypothetical protein [Bradyrhizobium sp. BRP20]|uniref:hypothetical protein n=1 Tax=Bradyrhizobium sp. BRP20 TaxID=2793822 RepID=UPI001CD395A4